MDQWPFIWDFFFFSVGNSGNEVFVSGTYLLSAIMSVGVERKPT